MREHGDGGDWRNSDTCQSSTSHSARCTNSSGASDSTDATMSSSLDTIFPSLSRPVDIGWSQNENGRRTSASVARLNPGDGYDAAARQSPMVPEPTRTEKRHDKFAHLANVIQQSTETGVRLPPCLLRSKERIHQLLVAAHADGPEPLSSMDDVELEVLSSKTVVAPVTRESLKELELPAIQNNLALRIDLCFDHELFFQRISGTKGEEKQRKAKIFWEVLSVELQAYAHALQHPLPGDCQACRNAGTGSVFIQSRLVAFFLAFRELLEMLVPDSDKQDVVQRVDVEWLTRQVRMGVFDAMSFSEWLLKLLMSHCAPMRDESAQDMHRQITTGAALNDIHMLVDGLETLLSLLENMKLDVANHQVRSFKLLLIADTVPFLRDCFSKLIDSRQLNFSSSQSWFRRARCLADPEEHSDLDVFTCSMVGLCTSANVRFPQTFAYDTERLQGLQDDIFDFVHLRICMKFYENLARKQTGTSPDPSQRQETSYRILQLVPADDRVVSHRGTIALEIARSVSDMSRNVPSSRPAQSDVDPDLDQAAASGLREALEQQLHSEMNFVSRLLANRTVFFTSQFCQLDTLQISNLQRTWSVKRSLKGLPLAPDLDDIARRLAHVAVIHWKVWSDLVYLDDSQPGPGFSRSS